MDYIKLDYDAGRKKALMTCTKRLFDYIRTEFSVFDKTAKAVRRFSSNSKIPFYKFAITPNGRFDAGLLFEIVNFLKLNKIEYGLDMTENFKKIIDSRFTSFSYTEGDEIFELTPSMYDYQREGVVNALQYGSGIFLFPTASGKTLMIAGMINNILKRNPNFKILVITLTSLVHQFVENFVDYGIDPNAISVWSSDETPQSTPIVIAGNTIVSTQLVYAEKEIVTMQKVVRELERKLAVKGITKKDRTRCEKTLAAVNKDLSRMVNKLEKNKIALAYFDSVDVLMVDEVHQCKKDNTITEVTDFVSTSHKFGFTGTMPTEKMDEWKVIGKFGPIRQSVSRQMLIDRGIIADVDIKVLDIEYLDVPEYVDLSEAINPSDLLKNFQIETEFLYNSNHRNTIITKVASGVSKNMLIIVDRISHGELLLERIRLANPDKKVYFIQGSVEDEARCEIEALMEKENGVVCIAIAKIFSTGVNIKNLHYILFANAWKARVSIIQSIGRGVRMLDGKHNVVVFDLHDILRYGDRHFDERKNIYETENFQYTNIAVGIGR